MIHDSNNHLGCDRFLFTLSGPSCNNRAHDDGVELRHGDFPELLRIFRSWIHHQGSGIGGEPPGTAADHSRFDLGWQCWANQRLGNDGGFVAAKQPCVASDRVVGVGNVADLLDHLCGTDSMGPKVFGLLDQGFADAIWIGARHGLRVNAAS